MVDYSPNRPCSQVTQKNIDGCSNDGCASGQPRGACSLGTRSVIQGSFDGDESEKGLEDLMASFIIERGPDEISICQSLYNTHSIN